MPPVPGTVGPGGGFAASTGVSGSFSTFTESSRTMLGFKAIAGFSGIFNSWPGFTTSVPFCTWNPFVESGVIQAATAFGSSVTLRAAVGER